MSPITKGLAVAFVLYAGLAINKANTVDTSPKFADPDTVAHATTYDTFHDIARNVDYKVPNKTSVQCLAENIYYEAGVEDTAGKWAVATVTLNRVKTGHWGNSVCGVVYAKKNDVCQFSWVCEKHKKPAGKVWKESMKIAKATLRGKRYEPVKKALFYHANYVKPYWIDKKKKVAIVGKHIFYTGAKNSWLTV